MDILLLPFLHLLASLIYFYKWLIIISVALNWLTFFGILNPYNRFVSILMDVIFRVTEPLLAWVRAKLPNFNGLDFSPFVVIFVLYFIENVIQVLIMKMMLGTPIKILS